MKSPRRIQCRSLVLTTRAAARSPNNIFPADILNRLQIRPHFTSPITIVHLSHLICIHFLFSVFLNFIDFLANFFDPWSLGLSEIRNRFSIVRFESLFSLFDFPFQFLTSRLIFMHDLTVNLLPFWITRKCCPACKRNLILSTPYRK